MSKISEEEMKHIANLSRLTLSNDELQKYTKDMEEILEFANMINNVSTEGLAETIAANERANVMRKDEVKPFKNIDLLLSNAPSQDEGMFRLPKVLNQ